MPGDLSQCCGCWSLGPTFLVDLRAWQPSCCLAIAMALETLGLALVFTLLAPAAMTLASQISALYSM